MEMSDKWTSDPETKERFNEAIFGSHINPLGNSIRSLNSSNQTQYQCLNLA